MIKNGLGKNMANINSDFMHEMINFGEHVGEQIEDVRRSCTSLRKVMSIYDAFIL